jgi:hypothetical protein
MMMQRFLVFATLVSGPLFLIGSCKDMGDELLPSTALAVGQDLFNLLLNDTTTTPITGGTPRYSIISNSDTTKVRSSISGALLGIRALALGSAIIVVGDSSSPRQSVTIRVNVNLPISFSAQIQPIFTAKCVNAGCHPGGSAPFPLVSGQSYGFLVGGSGTGVPATNGTGSCPGDKRVQPLNADASVLVKRITGTCGLAQMPLGGTPLSTAQIQLIRDWINQGARNN